MTEDFIRHKRRNRDHQRQEEVAVLLGSRTKLATSHSL